MLDGGGIITPPGPGFPVWKGFDAIFPALNAAAEKKNNSIINDKGQRILIIYSS